MKDIKLWALDTLERASTTLVQSLIMYTIVVIQSGQGFSWKPVVAALIPPVFTVILSAVPKLTPTFANRWADVAVRVLRTFLTTFIGAILATGFDLFDTKSWTAAFFLAGSAVLVIIKSEIARVLAEKRHASPKPIESLSNTSLAWKTA
jgi:hypothetical protein